MHRIQSPSTPRSRRWLVLVAAAAALYASSARADLTLTVQSVTVGPGTTNNALDLTLFNSGPSSVTVGGFSFQITASSPLIDFTQVTTETTTAPYIFGSNSLFGPDITNPGIAGGQTIGAADLFSIPGSGATLGAGTAVGLGHVFFGVSAAASGVYTVSIEPPPATALSDTSFPIPKIIPIDTLSGGTITVVPEPGSVVLSLQFLGFAGAARWARRRPWIAAILS